MLHRVVEHLLYSPLSHFNLIIVQLPLKNNFLVDFTIQKYQHIMKSRNFSCGEEERQTMPSRDWMFVGQPGERAEEFIYDPQPEIKHIGPRGIIEVLELLQ